MGQRVGLASELKPLGGGGAKASLNEGVVPAFAGMKFAGPDPKPGDLAMGRLKVR